MAYAHINFDENSKHGRRLRQLLNYIEQGDDLFADVRDAMLQMRDGDGSQAAHYARVTQLFGFDSDEKAREAFLELDSAYSKTSGNDTVDSVRAARDQLLAKLR